MGTSLTYLTLSVPEPLHDEFMARILEWKRDQSVATSTPQSPVSRLPVWDDPATWDRIARGVSVTTGKFRQVLDVLGLDPTAWIATSALAERTELSLFDIRSVFQNLPRTVGEPWPRDHKGWRQAITAEHSYNLGDERAALWQAAKERHASKREAA